MNTHSMIFVINFLELAVEVFCDRRRAARQTQMTQKESMDPLAFMNTAQLIAHWGYKHETYYLTVSDGYILTINRIARPASKLPPVIIQHGLFYASDLFVLRGPKKDLAFILADMNYDIWLPDLRGGTYSKNHTTLTPKEPKFWDFSYHEMGVIDCAEVIDFILAKTGKTSLIHLAHSMGTTAFYILASTRPEYNAKVQIHISLAPVCYLAHMRLNYLLRPLAENANTLLKMTREMGWFELLPRNTEFSYFLYSSMRNSGLQSLFLNAFLEIFGPDFKFLNKTAIPTFFSHCPSGTSGKTIQHFAQNLLRDEFAWYSYGSNSNLERYGSEKSPLYNLSAIATKISFHYSFNDYLSHPTDVERLARQLPNVVGMYPIQYKKFNHIDYLWATDSRRLFFDDIIKMIQRYSKPTSIKNI